MTEQGGGVTSKHVVVVGAGVAGLGTALALSRAGHRVTILERDATPTPADPDAAFTWDRRGAPQVRHSHALLARLRNLLRDRYPDVLEALLEAGATEMRFCDMMPPTIDDPSPRPGDDDLVALACRRTTFEWVLRRTVVADDDVALLDGVTATALRTAPATGRGEPPTVTGVDIDRHGTPGSVDADLVVVAAGRRTPLPRWLADLGVELAERTEDTGIVYFSRFYRLADDALPPPQDGPIGGDLGYLKYAVFQGDNRTFSVTFAVRSHDDELRRVLLDPATFDHAARLLPATAPWAAPGLAEPITEVHVMGGLLNRLLRFTDDDGGPLVAGLHAVGDTHTCTNPLYGRGCSLAMVQASLLADALAEHPDDAVARGRAYEAASAREIEPWYRAAVAQDRMARQEARLEQPADSGLAPEALPTEDDRDAGERGDDPGDDAAATPFPPEMVRDLLRDGLLPAVRTDATVFRAFIRAFNLLDAPDALMNDAELIGRVLAVYQDRDRRPPEPSLGPPRREMLAGLAAG